MEWGQGNMGSPSPYTCCICSCSRNCFRLRSIEPPFVWRFLRYPEDVESIMSNLLILASCLFQFKSSVTARCGDTYHVILALERPAQDAEQDFVSTNRKAPPKFYNCK